jgi:hypothetical protein
LDANDSTLEKNEDFFKNEAISKLQIHLSYIFLPYLVDLKKEKKDSLKEWES